MVAGSNARHTTATRHWETSAPTLQDHFSVVSYHGHIKCSRRHHSIRSTTNSVHRRGVETPNNEHRTRGRAGKSRTGGSVPSGNTNKPVRGESRGQKPTAARSGVESNSFMKTSKRPSGSKDRLSENQKPLFRRNKHFRCPSTTMPARTQDGVNNPKVAPTTDVTGKSARAGGSSQPKKR